MFLMAAFWYFLPNSIYKKSLTFQDQFIMNLNEIAVVIETARGEVVWDWRKFTNFFESPHFFHLYFDTKSFFLIPKENISTELQHELRGLLNRNIKK
jgi:hypothetical protein